MNIWQVIMILLFGANFGINSAKHGQYRMDKYNAYTALVSILIEVFILVKGGFFG